MINTHSIGTLKTMISPENIILIITATTTALMAGLFYSWSCSVTIGLAMLPDKEYIDAMQSMNRAILNPAFFICFFGAAILLPLSTYVEYGKSSTSYLCLLAATIAYLAGVMGITIFGNVPLNEALDAFHTHTASSKDIAVQRINFENLWNRLNMIRTCASLVSIIFVVIACLTARISE